MSDRTKYRIKTSLELTETQALIVENIAAALTTQHGKRVSKKAVHRLMVEHCATCELFFSTISIEQHISAD